jgi:hypothetical protein
MGNVTDLNEFRKKKEIEEERKVARELQQLLSEIMYDDETPLIISYEDSDGIHYYNLDDIMGLSDSNPYEK